MQKTIFFLSLLTIAVGFLLRPLVAEATCKDRLQFETAYDCEVNVENEGIGTFALTFFEDGPDNFFALTDLADAADLGCHCKPKGNKPTKPKFGESNEAECVSFNFPFTLEALVNGNGTKLKKGKGLFSQFGPDTTAFVFTCEVGEALP